MALIIEDRVMETSTSSGTGTITLAGAYTAYKTFASVCAVGDTLYYIIETIDVNGVATGEWESGLGTYSAANTLTRTAAHNSSAADAAVNFGAGTKRVGLARISGHYQSESLVIAIGDETTAITTGVAKVTFRMPYAFLLDNVRASLTTASSSGIPTFDINEAGVSILSTKLTIDASEKTSVTAATPHVFSDTALADDAEMTIDVDVAGTGAAGAKIVLIGRRV